MALMLVLLTMESVGTVLVLLHRGPALHFLQVDGDDADQIHLNYWWHIFRLDIFKISSIYIVKVFVECSKNIFKESLKCYCWSLLLKYCKTIADFFCWNIVDMLLMYCWNIVEILLKHCWQVVLLKRLKTEFGEDNELTTAIHYVQQKVE